MPLMNGKQVYGIHQVVLKDLALPTGISFAHLQVDGMMKVIQLFGAK